MSDITFTYSTIKTGLKNTTLIKLDIPHFVIFLEENTYHDIRTRHRDRDGETEDETEGSDMRILLKINLQRYNNIIDIYYLSLDPVVVKADIMLSYSKDRSYPQYYSIINKPVYESIGAYKWQHIKTLYKQDFNTNPTYQLPSNQELNIKFHFTVILSSDELAGTLSNDFEYLLKNEDHSDVNIVSADQMKFKVHKAILASRSAVLKAHFDHNTTECLSNVVESPLESEVLKEVLAFIYSDKSPRVNEISDKLLAAADYYQLGRLKSLCEEALHTKLAVNNAIDTLQLADLHSAESLKQWTLEFIKDQAGLITETESWSQIDNVKLIKMIFEYMAINDIGDYKGNEIKYCDVEEENDS